MRRITLLISLFICFTTSLIGQDGRYWSESFGNQSVLLNGSVVGSVSDLGAVFYNPARLSLLETRAFVISAKVYELSTVTVEDGVSENSDLKENKFGNAPSLAAGSFTLPFLKDHKFAVSFLTRQKTKADFFITAQNQGDLVDAIPGEELVIADLNYSIALREEWLGLTWSYPFSKKFGIGLSSFFSFINKGSVIQLDMNALDETNSVASLERSRTIKYNSSGILWKFGSSLDLGAISMGLSITTPRVNFGGQGSALLGDFLVNVDRDGDGETDDVFVSYAQQGMKVTYKTPWAIGFGVGIPFKKGILHLSTEWYDKVPKYALMETDPYAGQSTGDTTTFALVDELDQVWNFGIGLEWYLKNNLTAYISYATDNSGVPTDITRFAELESEASNSVFNADFYKLAGGISIDSKKIDLTLGLVYTGGDQDIPRPINFPDEDDDPIFDSDNTSNIGFNQWRFILGLTIPYGAAKSNELPIAE